MKKLFTTVGLVALVATPVLAQIKESGPAAGARQVSPNLCDADSAAAELGQSRKCEYDIRGHMSDWILIRQFALSSRTIRPRRGSDA